MLDASSVLQGHQAGASNMQKHSPVNEPIRLVATMGSIQNGCSVVP